MSNVKLSRYRVIVTFIILIIFLIQISLCFFLWFSKVPDKKVSKFRAFYYNYILTGPFFKDNSIKSSSHFYLSYKKEGRAWTPFTDLTEYYFALYQRSPWEYDKIALRNYPGDVLRRLRLGKKKKRSKKQIKESSAFYMLNDFVSYANLVDEKADSVHVIYRVKGINLRGAERIDTLLNVKYSLSEIKKNRPIK